MENLNTAVPTTTTSNIPDTWERNIGPNRMLSDPVPQMDIVTPSLRKAIVESKDIILASLLISGYEYKCYSTSNFNVFEKPDRLLS